MILRKHPRLVWPTIFLMLWASIIMPISVTAASAGPVTASGVSSEDDAPLGQDVYPGEEPPVPEEAPADATPALPDEPPATAGSEKQVEVVGDEQMQLQLQNLLAMQQAGQSPPFQENITGPASLFSNGIFDPTLFPSMKVGATSAVETPWSLRYKGQEVQAQLGDIPAAINGNELVTLNRNVRGMQLDAVIPKGSFSGMVSEIKSTTQTDSFDGQNSSGPYYLTMSPIAAGSEMVMVNNQEQAREKDYTLEYTTGVLNFTQGRMIRPTDHISVSYSVIVDGMSGGQLVALRGSYPVSNQLTVGVSHIGLKGSKHGAAVDSVEREERDDFQGKNSAGPFYLTYRPVVANSETLTINGAKQQRGIAYTLEYATGKLLFTNGHLPVFGAAVVVRYRVAASNAETQDRSISGVDVNWQNGKGLGVNIQAAQSSGGQQPVASVVAQEVVEESFSLRANTPPNRQTFQLRKTPIQEGSEQIRALAKPLIRNQDYTLDYQTGALRLLNNTIPTATAGPTLFVTYTPTSKTSERKGNTAVVATATYSGGNISAMTRIRKTDPGFAPLEQSSINPAERAVEWSGSYSASDALTFSTSGDNSRIPALTYLEGMFTQGATLRQENRSYMIDYHKENQPGVMLQHSSHNATRSDDERIGDISTSNTLSTSWSKKGISSTLTLDRTTTSNRQANSFAAPAQDGTVNEIAEYKSTVDSASLNLGYQPHEKVNVGINLSTNKIDANNDGVKSSTRVKSVQANASYRPQKNLSVNANVSASETVVAKTTAGEVTPPQKNRNLSLSADWQPAKKVNGGVNFASDQYDGGDYGAYKTSTLSSSVGWHPKENISLLGYWANQLATDPALTGTTRSNLLGMNTQFSPVRNTTIGVDVQRLQGKSSEGVNQLWQTEGQAKRGMMMPTDSLGSSALSANKLTAVSGNLTYKLNDKQDVALTGELLNGDSQEGKSTRRAFGVGWRYHPDENLSFSMDARRVAYTDAAASGLNDQANEVSAELSWKF